MNWIRSNPYQVTLVFTIALSIAAVMAPHREPPLQISVDQDGPMILLEWATEPGAMFYEIQRRILAGDFETLAIMPGGEMETAIPPGAAEFRVRAWTISGPGKWGAPTGWIFFMPPPEPWPPPENSGGPAAKVFN